MKCRLALVCVLLMLGGAANALAADAGLAPTAKPLNSWVQGADGNCRLSYDINWRTQDLDPQGKPRVIDLMQRNHPEPDDGIYMYVFRKDGKLYIRPNDRGTSGVNGVSGDEKYLPAFNPDGQNRECPWKPDPPKPHMYARHSQLANGLETFSAGMLQYGGGKLLWVSNESGHYQPEITRVEYMVRVLKDLKEPGADSAAICEKKLDHVEFSNRGIADIKKCPVDLFKLP
jgi:hypothetical protein